MTMCTGTGDAPCRVMDREDWWALRRWGRVAMAHKIVPASLTIRVGGEVVFDSRSQVVEGRPRPLSLLQALLAGAVPQSVCKCEDTSPCAAVRRVEDWPAWKKTLHGRQT